MRVLHATAVLIGASLALGCASQQQADRAIKAAEDAMTAQHAAALRFAPDSFAGVMKEYQAARQAYAARDWAGAIKAADAVSAKTQQLPAAVAAGRDRAKAGWPLQHDSVRTMLAALSAQLDAIGRSRRYPEGWSATDVRDARTKVDSLAAGLAKAKTGFDAGDLDGALHATEQVRAEAIQLMRRVGLIPSNPHQAAGQPGGP